MNKILIISTFLFTSLIYANFADTYGISAQEISKGNAVTATVNNWSSAYYNMAGLGKTAPHSPKGDDKKQTPPLGGWGANELGISYMYTIGNLNLNIDKETSATNDLSFGTITFGLALDLRNFVNLPDAISSARFGLLMGMMQDGTLVKINDLDIRSHSFLRYGRDIQRSVIFSGLGLGFIKDMFGIGLGVHVWTTGKGKIEMTNLELNSDTQIPSSQTQLDVSPKIVPALGFYFSYADFDLGFSYKHEIYMEMPLETNASMMLAGVEMEMELFVFDFYTPTSLTLGIAYNLFDLIFSIDLEYQMWSKFKTSKSVDKLVTQYNEDGGDQPDISIPKMKDIIIPKIGISYTGIKSLKLNAGYYYRPTFLPEDSGKTLFNYMDSDAQVISVGVNYALPKNDIFVADIELNLTAQMQILSLKNVKKDDAFYDGVLNPDYSYSGNTISLFAEILMRW